METREMTRVYKRADLLIHERMPGSYIGVQVGRRMAVEEHFFQRAYEGLYKDEQAELGKLLTDMVEILGTMQQDQYHLKVALVQELDPSPEPEFRFWVHLRDEFEGRSFQFVPTVEFVRAQIHGNNVEVYVGPQRTPYLGDTNTLWSNRVVHGWRGRILPLPAQDREMVVTPHIVLFDPPAHLESVGLWVGVSNRAHAEKTIGFFRGIMKGLAGRRTSPVVLRIEELLRTGYVRATTRVDEQSDPDAILADLQKLLGEHG